MAEDLTPKITRAYDSAQFEPGGSVRETTVIQYTIGRHGPFTHTFDRNPSKFQIEQMMAERRRQFEGLS